MSRIAVLPPSVADQIAAGEVVERPASVVKELVENALDADAREVLVELEEGGRVRVRVTDDGGGMDAEDARLALSRHATSKIRSAADLIGVGTYGFRGEALPAIASVSRFQLETAPSGGAVGRGTKVIVQGGRIETVEPANRQPGTTIQVDRLFFNTPARRKFLRSQRAETRAAVEAVTVLALSRLDVTFKVLSDGRVLLDAPAVSDPLDRISALFGRKLVDQLVPLRWDAGPLGVEGFVQRPADARPAGRKTFLFINGRPFRDPFLIRAAEAGYRGAIAPGARPSLFLALLLPGDQVDVNVHPAKLEVRFRDRFFIERSVEEAVRESLRGLGSAVEVGSGGRENHGAEAHYRGTWGGTGGAAVTAPAAMQFEAPPGLFDPEPSNPRIGNPVQVFNTYILLETPDGIAVIDQHSAHERVLYERAMAELSGESSAAQRLLMPITLDLEARELEVVEEHADQLRAIGYEVEPFGGRSVVIHAVPNPRPGFDAQRCFEEMVADLSRGRLGGMHNRLERFAATYGCRAAVKAGEKLEPEAMRRLINAVFACTLPPHDVHGRPTIVQLPKHELDRRFGRV